MAGAANKDELIRQIDAARATLSQRASALQHSAEALREKLDIPTRISASVEKHRGAWMGGAALLGILLSKLPARKKTVVVENASTLGKTGKFALLWSATKFAATVAKPFLSDTLGKQIADYARRFSTPQPPSASPQPPSPPPL